MGYKFSKFKKGFSLVELLAVIAIMAIMTGILLTNKNTENKAQIDVEAAAREVAAQIRALQNEALNGKMIGNASVCKYKFDANTSGYTLTYMDCANGVVGSQVFDLSKKRVVFEGSPFVYFLSPSANVNGVTSIKIKSTAKPTISMFVCVSAGGSVEEKTSCP